MSSSVSAPQVTRTSPARCGCGAPATNQAIYRKHDGSHFLGGPTCDVHRVSVGPLRYATGSEVVDYFEVAS